LQLVVEIVFEPEHKAFGRSQCLVAGLQVGKRLVVRDPTLVGEEARANHTQLGVRHRRNRPVVKHVAPREDLALDAVAT
jgi:hypothetical protein